MKAYATLLTQPNYLPGVRVLRASLERVRSAHPLLVMVTRNIDAGVVAQLLDDGCLVRTVEPIRPDGGLSDKYANARFAEVWTKLAVWQQTDFDRIVFLDADMLVTQNMDELFELELAEDQIAACHACRCNPNKIASYPADWIPENCFYSNGDGDDGGSDHRDPGQAREAGAVGDYLNAGFLVLRPDQGVFAQLMAELAEVDDLLRYPFAEQDFLNEHFDQRWRPLSYVYNALKTLPFQHPLLWHDSAVKNIHYIIDKPWQREPDPADRYFALTSLWWDVARDVLSTEDRVLHPTSS